MYYRADSEELEDWMNILFKKMNDMRKSLGLKFLKFPEPFKFI